MNAFPCSMRLHFQSLSMPGANAEGGKKGNPARRIGSTTVLHCSLSPFSVGRRRSLARSAHQNRCVNRSERRRSQRTLDENLSGAAAATRHFFLASTHGPVSRWPARSRSLALLTPGSPSTPRMHSHSSPTRWPGWELERYLVGEAV